jgi:hypothetical protein
MSARPPGPRCRIDEFSGWEPPHHICRAQRGPPQLVRDTLANAPREHGRQGGGRARRPSRERGLAQKAEHAVGVGIKRPDAFQRFAA